MSTKSLLAASLLMLQAGVPAFAGGGVPFLNQGFSPTSVAPNTPGFTLMVTGSGFSPSTKVFWNRKGRNTTFISSDKLMVSILPQDVLVAGTSVITVQNPQPGGGTSNARFFSVANTVSTISLMKEQKHLVGNGAVALAVGDLNGDASPDVATANSIDGTVSVLFGNRAGQFSIKHDYPTAASPMAIVIADVNGDGINDLITGGGSTGSGFVSVLLGTGHGNFAAHADFATDIAVGSMASGDLNRDGKLDLLACPVPTASSSGCVVLLGNGDGTFGTSTAVGGTSFLSGPQLGDFNGDGILDFAAQASYFFGKGDGTFGPAHVLPSSIYAAMAVTLADLNGDGNLDIAVMSQLSGSVCYQSALGDGTGHFVLANAIGVAGSSLPNTVLAYDFNGDGKMDAMIDDSSGYSPNNFGLGNGDGTISSFRPLGGPETAVSPIAFGDFNSDGRMDIVGLTNGQYPTLKLYLQQ